MLYLHRIPLLITCDFRQLQISGSASMVFMYHGCVQMNRIYWIESTSTITDCDKKFISTMACRCRIINKVCCHPSNNCDFYQANIFSLIFFNSIYPNSIYLCFWRIIKWCKHIHLHWIKTKLLWSHLIQ